MICLSYKKKNISNELIVYFLFFSSIMDKFIIKKPRRPQDSSPTQDSSLTQDSSSKHGRVDVNNLPLDPKLRKIDFIYHPSD